MASIRRHSNYGLRKRCGCSRKQWPKCEHPWHFNFKWNDTHYRISLDRHVGHRIEGKIEAADEAEKLRRAIKEGRYGVQLPARDTLTLEQLLKAYVKDYVTPERPRICHMRSMTTGSHVTAALANKVVNLFSDLLVHNIGTGDGISQGGANSDQFRTAPLWGVGQRLFFLHDGRFTNIVDAIKAHSGPEATEVIKNFNGASGATAPLSTTESQNLVYFLRSL